MPSINTGVTISTSEDRAAYMRVYKHLQKRHPNQQFIITPTDLRLESALLENNNLLRFDPYEGNANTDRPLENKLSRKDMFFITHVALGIAKFDDTSGNGGTYPIYHYPDSNYFDGVKTGINEWESLENLWNGTLSMKTGSIERLDNFLLLNCRYVPPAPYTELGGTPSPNAIHAQYGPSHGERGFYPIVNTIVLDGDESNDFTVALGEGERTNIDGSADSAGAGVDPGTRNVAILLLKGFLVNGTVAPSNKICNL